MPKGTRTVYMTGGGPASGKTTGLLNNPKAGIPDKHNAAHINPDDSKAVLPEFREGVKNDDKNAANYVHEESSYMAKEATTSSLQAGHDVVYDTTGDSGIEKLSGKVQVMRDSGAKHIVAHYATLDVDEAVKRSDARYEKAKMEFKKGKGPPPRYVAHEYLRSQHDDVNRTALAAIKHGTFDKLDIWDTGGPHGEPPVHVASYDKAGGGLKVHDEGAWSRFQKRGGQ